MIFQHEPVGVDNVLALLQPVPGGIYCDATVGGGGHAEKVLEACAPDGRLVGIDQDPEAVPLGDVEVAIPDPDKNAIGFTNITAAEVRRRTYETFTEKTGRKFHAYERAVD